MKRIARIVVEHEENVTPGFYARLEGANNVWGSGNSIQEAIGDLIYTQTLIFSDIKIRTGKGIERPTQKRAVRQKTAT